MLATLPGPGCGSTRATGPARAVQEYIAAVRADDAKKAYALLADSARRQLTEAEFVERWRGLKGELLAQAKQLAARLEKPIAVQAAMRYAGGASAKMTFDGSWRLDAGVSIAPPAATPLEALAALAAALDRRSYDAVLKVLARSLRQTIETEAADRVAKLKAWLGKGAEIEVTGDRARVRYDPRYRIELINEDGQWRVIDYN